MGEDDFLTSPSSGFVPFSLMVYSTVMHEEISQDERKNPHVVFKNLPRSFL
jgi:hypothetical protein